MGVPAEPPYSYRDTQGHLGTIQLLGAGKTLGNTTRGLPGDSSVTLYIHHGDRQLYGSPWQPFSRAAHPDPSGPAAQLRDGAGRALGTWTFCRVTPLDLSGTLGTLTHAPTPHPRGKLATWQGWRSFLSPTSQVELELEVEVAGHGCVGPQLKGGGGTAFEEVGPTTQDQ